MISASNDLLLAALVAIWAATFAFGVRRLQQHASLWRRARRQARELQDHLEALADERRDLDCELALVRTILNTPRGRQRISRLVDHLHELSVEPVAVWELAETGTLLLAGGVDGADFMIEDALRDLANSWPARDEATIEVDPHRFASSSRPALPVRWASRCSTDKSLLLLVTGPLPLAESDPAAHAAFLTRALRLAASGWTSEAFPLPAIASEDPLAGPKLELRLIAEDEHESSLQMLEAYLRQLLDFTGFATAQLFLSQGAVPGTHLEHGSSRRWIVRVSRSEHVPDCEQGPSGDAERQLADCAAEAARAALLGQSDLLAMGFDLSVAQGAVAPLEVGERRFGAFYLLADAPVAAPHDAVDLIDSAAGHLSRHLIDRLQRRHWQREATLDALTHLFNRREFDRRLTAMMDDAVREDHSASLLLVDLDHFKQLNDTYGHPAGDAVLSNIARTIKGVLDGLAPPARPVAARYGGEEFAILLPRLPAAEAARVAELIRRSIAATHTTYNGLDHRKTASIGWANFPRHAGTAAEMLQAADNALYSAKEAGRNRVRPAIDSLATQAVMTTSHRLESPKDPDRHRGQDDPLEP